MERKGQARGQKINNWRKKQKKESNKKDKRERRRKNREQKCAVASSLLI